MVYRFVWYFLIWHFYRERISPQHSKFYETIILVIIFLGVIVIWTQGFALAKHSTAWATPPVARIIGVSHWCPAHLKNNFNSCIAFLHKYVP
jgi:hypothetical protein